jgi:hypothetical protein
MVNLGLRRTGLMPGTEDERDLAQVKLAIESVRALTPQIESVAPDQAAPIRDALSQLQMAFVQASGGEPQTGPTEPPASPGGEPDPQEPDPDGPGPAQQSGRLWVPGQ